MTPLTHSGAFSRRCSLSAAPTRLVVVQGPVQSLAACAAVCHAERRWGAGYRNVMLLGSILADDGSAHYGVVRAACLECAAAVDWGGVLDMADAPDVHSLRAAVGGDVAEVVCARNWQPVNELALTSFPGARRVVVGDGLGVIDPDRDPSFPQFDLALPVIPQPLYKDSLEGTPLEVVPRETLLDMVASARSRSPQLCRVDAELAGFAKGGMLLLMNYLTEAYQATLRGEIELALQVARLASRGPDLPIVIKPHPRNSLGQPAAVARRLRAAGHQVRIMGQLDYGHYPIELFEKLLLAVDRVHAQGSTSAISISFLYGVRATAELPARAARRALLPRDRPSNLNGFAWVSRILDELTTWDGRSPFPVPRPRSPRLIDRVLGRLARPITWAPASRWRRRLRPWNLPPLPSSAVERLGDPDPNVVTDSAARVAWLLRDSEARLVDLVRLSESSAPVDRVMSTLLLLSQAPNATVGVVAATLPTSYAPGWQRWWRRIAGITIVEGAQLSAEQLEDLLETRTDVLLRLPEVGLTLVQTGRWRTLALLRRWPPPGFVVFVCRVRASAVDSPTAS